jgi:hypothetical protein
MTSTLTTTKGKPQKSSLRSCYRPHKIGNNYTSHETSMSKLFLSPHGPHLVVTDDPQRSATFLRRRGHSTTDRNGCGRMPATFTFCDAAPVSSFDESDDSHSVESELSVDHESQPLAQQPSRRVRFSERVKVCEIPNRHAYPEDVKFNLWNSRVQTKRAACRNSFEYAWEGRSWRSAVEEQRFLPLQGGQRWVHPAHFRQWAEENEEQYSASLRYNDISHGVRISQGTPERLGVPV